MTASTPSIPVFPRGFIRAGTARGAYPRHLIFFDIIIYLLLGGKVIYSIYRDIIYVYRNTIFIFPTVNSNACLTPITAHSNHPRKPFENLSIPRKGIGKIPYLVVVIYANFMTLSKKMSSIETTIPHQGIEKSRQSETENPSKHRAVSSRGSLMWPRFHVENEPVASPEFQRHSKSNALGRRPACEGGVK